MPDNEEIIDLTELIETGPKAEAKPAKAADGAAGSDDIDALLAQMDAQDEMTVSKPAAKTQVDPNESLDMSGMGAVDDLLGSLDIPLEPRNAGKAQSVPADETPAAPGGDELDNAVDELLSDVTPPDVAPKKESAPAGPDSLVDDLDSLLGGMDLETAAPGSPKAGAAPAKDGSGSKPGAGGAKKAPPAKDRTAPEQPAPDDDLDSLLGDLDLPPSPGAGKTAKPLECPDRAMDLESMPEAAPMEQKTATVRAKAPDSHELPPDLDDMLAELDMKGTARQPDATDAGHGRSPAMTARELAQISAPLATAPAQEARPAESAPADNQLQAELMRQESRRLDSLSQLNEKLSQRLDSLGQLTERLSLRLEHCEGELTRAMARLEAVEKAAESASLEDLLCEGNSLHDRFAALIARSVSEAFKNAPPQTDPAVMERMENIAMMNKSVSARMDAMENRLDLLEPRFNREVEKAAALAVVKILREEIARLGQGTQAS